MHMIWGGGFPYLFNKHTALVHARHFTNVNAFTSQNNPTTLFYNQDTEAQLPQLVSGITGVSSGHTDSPAAPSQGWDGLQTPSFLLEGPPSPSTYSNTVPSPVSVEITFSL